MPCDRAVEQRILPMRMMQKAHDLMAPRRIDVRHLRLVLAIAREGSVTRAAGRLHLSQSAVSHQLLDLERELDARLFDRVGKRMVATPAGARMLGAAERLLAELAELEGAIARADGTARLPLRITTSCFTSYYWLPAALAHFGDSHPNIDLDVVLEATRRAVPALIADEVDLAIVTAPPRDDTWQRVEVAQSELVAIGSPDHPALARARRDTLRWGALHDAEILVYDISDHDLERLHDAIRASWQAESGRRLATPLTVRKVPLSEALVELARSGRGVGIVDRWNVASALDRGLVALALTPRAPRTFHAVWRRSNPRGLPIHELIKVIQKAGARITRLAKPA
jgi:LysR family transcriptional regulator, regulator for metE and metH